MKFSEEFGVLFGVNVFVWDRG